MFTGIIEEIGCVEHISYNSLSCHLYIRCSYVLEGTKIGDSIAVNGACLTVSNLNSCGFEADVTPETMRRTAFSMLRNGSPVNLERALRMGDRFGGHIVLGHVDTTARISGKQREGNAQNISVRIEQEWDPYILEKGSITIDGISLTVAKKQGKIYTVAVIPHTLEETTLISKKIGDMVNIECDYLGKYIESLTKRRECHTLSIEDLEGW